MKLLENHGTTAITITPMSNATRYRYRGLIPSIGLPRRQPNLGCHFAAIGEVVSATDADQQCAGGNRTDAGKLHQALAARIVAA